MIRNCAFFFILFICSLSTALVAQDTSKVSIDIRRVKLHEDIDRQQDIICGTTPLRDKMLKSKLDTDLAFILTDLFIRQIDDLQDFIEIDKTTDHRIKVKYLTGLLLMLEKYDSGIKTGIVEPGQGIILFDVYKELLLADRNGASLLDIATRQSLAVNQVFFGVNSIFYDNLALKAIRLHIYKQFAAANPTKVLLSIEPYLEEPFSDTLIIASAKAYPMQFYDYAAATTTKLGQKIRQIKERNVQLLVKLADDKSGRLIFPFMSFILNGRLNYDSVSEAARNDFAYYRLLVKTQNDYVKNLRARDTPILYQEIGKMIAKKAKEIFINEVNALHDESDEVRFKILRQLNFQELYYIIVTGEDVLYTSSYTGIYNRLMSAVPHNAGDSMLMQVRFDRFRKFIKMAAGYNRLDPFLASMPDSSAALLMVAFARGLERSIGLEDAVDVADSYSSIKDENMKEMLRDEIASDFLMQKSVGNKRGEVIYDILSLLFSSADDSSGLLTSRFHIPPVYKLSFENLADQAGRVVQQVFFYGDKDGKESFVNFMSLYNGKTEWKVTKKENWVEIKSLVGKSVWIFANLPFENVNGDDPDAKAQRLLSEYLSADSLYPTVVIHRGHSYHLKYTVNQLPASAKIIVLGSCGGYQNLNAVLDICPEAHIISSKEVGTKIVNDLILKLINESLRMGDGVDWITIWNKLEKQFASGVAKERFGNYIPPHKNLGALFIKAYSNSMR
jgi:hypothetical protein